LPGRNLGHDAYEVILVQVRNTNHKGEPVDPYEGYPAAESWGKKGWTFTTPVEAIEELEQLVQEASCAGTVSRRNRSGGQVPIQGSGPTSKRFTSHCCGQQFRGGLPDHDAGP